jgi:hypothetical protein
MSSKQHKLRRHQNLRHGDNAVPADRLVTQAAPRRAPEPAFPRISRERVELLLRGGPSGEASDG